MDDDAGGPQSLFLVVSWCPQSAYSSSIIQLEIPPQVESNHEAASSSSANTPPVFPLKFSAHFPHLADAHAGRVICLQIATSNEDLYMLPDWPSKKISEKEEEQKDGTLPGFIFNLSSKKCKLIKPPLAPKYMGHSVMLGDHIYFMAQPHLGEGPMSPDIRFERYDTLSQKWEKLEPLPLDPTYGDFYTGFIAGTAVLDDTILFYIDGTMCTKTLMAYNVVKNKWYPVKVLNDLCYSLLGVAVVLNGIIYGLTKYPESIVALTLTRQEKHGDLVFTCNLHKEYKVPDMAEVKFDRWWHTNHRTKHLVHLGEDKFCLVQSGNCSGSKYQYILLTIIEVSEKKSTVTDVFIYELKIPGRGGIFWIKHCFFVPKRKTATALEHETQIVTLPPELVQFQDRNIIDAPGALGQLRLIRDDADTKAPQVQEDVPMKSSATVVAGINNVPSKPSNIDEEGHSIWVTNLPPYPNYRQLVIGLNIFGPIKKLALNMDYTNTSESFAHVEYESATSKQDAIKASAVNIGNHIAVIGEKRGGTGLTEGDSSRSISKTSTPYELREELARKIANKIWPKRGTGLTQGDSSRRISKRRIN